MIVLGDGNCMHKRSLGFFEDRFVIDEMGQEKQLCETWATRCFVNAI